ncbi:MAG: ABC transporter ATP-binding protein [Planctomycetota bacterium]|jgi:ABC-2 type transport system ATP-binding protein
MSSLPSTAAIVTEGLTKYYGATPGIVDLDLEVRRGEVFGFLGPNGAGKSTTIRTLLDFLHPTRGRARIFDLDTRRDSLAIRRRVGYLPADLALYPEMTGRELLFYFASLRGTDSAPRANAIAERLGLDLDRRNSDYSSGNRQKVGIVQAFMDDPELLILDEPTSGLDPLVQQEFHRLIDEVREQGRTVFLSSHVLPEVERLADRVGIVRESRLVAVDEIGSLKAKALRRLEIVFGEAVDVALFRDLPGVRRAEATADGRGVSLDVAGAVDGVLRAAAAHPIEDLSAEEADLEAVFLAYYDGDER